MRTEAQINASRLNGAKSRGPVTDAGKAASSLNALKHGMLARTLLIDGESPESFHEMANSISDEFEPATAFEESLVEIMIAARWRQERLWNVERANLNIQIGREKEMQPALQNKPAAANAVAFKRLGDDSRSLDLILRYESRYDRQYLRAHKRLLEVQKARLAKGEPEPQPHPPKPVAQVIPIDRAQQPEPEPAPPPAPIDTLDVASDSGTLETAKRTQHPNPADAESADSPLRT